MATVKLANCGREVTINLAKISIKDWREMVNPAGDVAMADDVLGRACGMTRDEVQSLPFPDYQQLIRAVLDAAAKPHADPS